jgi:hypothetical protein
MNSRPAGRSSPPASTWDVFNVERKKYQSEEMEKVDVTAFLFGFRTRDGKPFKVASRAMKISGSEKSGLFGFLKSWLGQAPRYGWDYMRNEGQKAPSSPWTTNRPAPSPALYTRSSRPSRRCPRATASGPACCAPGCGHTAAGRRRPSRWMTCRRRRTPVLSPRVTRSLPTVRGEQAPHHRTGDINMAVLFKSNAPASHWYAADGSPVHEMPGRRR